MRWSHAPFGSSAHQDLRRRPGRHAGARRRRPDHRADRSPSWAASGSSRTACCLSGRHPQAHVGQRAARRPGELTKLSDAELHASSGTRPSGSTAVGPLLAELPANENVAAPSCWTRIAARDAIGHATTWLHRLELRRHGAPHAPVSSPARHSARRLRHALVITDSTTRGRRGSAHKRSFAQQRAQ